MGKFWGRGAKTKDEIISDIDKINKITYSELFNKKTSFLIKFEMSINLFNKLIGNCEINAHIVFFFYFKLFSKLVFEN